MSEHSAENDLRPWLTVKDTASRLGVHENTVRKWAADGTLTDARVPGTSFLRLLRAEVDHLAAARHVQAVEGAQLAADAAIAELRVTVARAEAFLAKFPGGSES